MRNKSNYRIVLDGVVSDFRYVFGGLSGYVYKNFVHYPAPMNLTYLWNFGVYATICLILQIVTGLFVSMHYAPEQFLAFFSVEHLMRDVNYGWLLRYLHANGASFFFIVVYIHLFRSLYYGSYLYPRRALWIVGVIILLLMILTAFLGYVLPWGQMSFWGATVITNLVSAVPYIGGDIVIWLWGGYSVSNATLNRFYTFHFLFPFLILGLSLVHFYLLHLSGSNNPLGISVKWTDEQIRFYPYYIVKDIFGLLVFFIIFFIFVFFYPNLLGHPDNYIEANAMVTPEHIVPEWYFLPFYAILRSIPDKLGGVIAMVLSIVLLAILPYLASGTRVRSLDFRPFAKLIFFFFLFDCFLLGWIGSCPAEYPYVTVGQLCSVFYFSYILFLVPVSFFIEWIIWEDSRFFFFYKKKGGFVIKG
jgi:ubiquinol-cytochrome c reductase cytochrome b/c1 subunit